MHKRPISAVIFDLDGTLADTFPLIVKAWNEAVSPHTGKTYSEEEVIARFGIPDPQMIRRELPGAAGEEADRVYHAAYEREHSIVTKFAGVDEMLAELKRRNIQLGLMTGKGLRSAKITLKSLGWADFFTAVITGEDVKEQKPAAEGPLKAADILNVSADACAFVGDSPADIGAAQNAKMLSVMAGWHDVYHDAVKAMRPDVWANEPMDVVHMLSVL